jgi:tetratricopeptide (TPR) repeat protein
MAHLDEEHGSQVSNENFERIMARSTFRTFGIADCPLCNDSGPVDSPELIAHVLGHIYDFSMYALPWQTIPQKALQRPIRTFNDVALVLDPDDNTEATRMRFFSHARVLKWVNEPTPEESDLTPKQKGTIRDLGWDDYQVIDDDDRADPIVADYFDRAGIDYFEDDASSHRVSSQAGHSTSTRRWSTASGSGDLSHPQANPSLSDPDEDGIEAMYERELEDRNKSLGPDHKSTLDVTNRLGNLYKKQGRLQEAEEMYVRALRGYEEALGSKHTSTLDTVNNLGILYADQGKLKEAEEMYVRALRGYEEAWGAEHTSTLSTVNNLGILYADQGKLKEAEEMYVRALRGKEEALGSEHTSTLDTVNNLAVLYKNQGRLQEAEEMYVRALRGYDEALGSKHTSTLDTVNNLGNLYSSQGKMKEAEEMLLRALRGKEEALGAKHTSTLNTANDLGNLYKNQGKMKEAEEMYLRALQGKEEA